MLSTKIFRESPFKALKIMGVIGGGVFLLMIVLISFDEMPGVTDAGLNKSAFLLLIMGSVFGGFGLLTFLILSFQRRKTVKCDFDGFEVLETNFWKIGGSSDGFKWNEVTDTNIVENLHSAGEGGVISQFTFVADDGKRQISLLDFKTSTKSNVEGLVDYVSQATPHAKYHWVKDADAAGRPSIESVYGFTKAARNG